MGFFTPAKISVLWTLHYLLDFLSSTFGWNVLRVTENQALRQGTISSEQNLSQARIQGAALCVPLTPDDQLL